MQSFQDAREARPLDDLDGRTRRSRRRSPAYAAAGFDAIGLWEFKLPPDDAANRALLAEHGLSVANCVPTVPSFLPLAIPGLEGPPDPAERLEAICASITRLAAYEPDCVLCLAGRSANASEAEARPLVLDGLRRAAETARTAGVRLAFEPIHPGAAGDDRAS